MARQKEPVALLRAKEAAGTATHAYTGPVLAIREAREVKVDLLDIHPPSYLTKKQKATFNKLSRRLQHVGIFTEIDEEMLGQYIVITDFLHQANRSYEEAFETKDIEEITDAQAVVVKWLDRQIKLSSKLGLNVMDRCRIVVPPKEETVSKFAKFRKPG